MTKQEKEIELEYLEEVESVITNNISDLKEYLDTEKTSIDDQKADFRSTANLSANEKDLTFDEINRRLGDYSLKQQEYVQFKKMKSSPYFGRVDVTDDESEEKFNNYIGYRSLVNKKSGFYILDWRAPIASFFYDYEKGKVSYSTINGKFKGEIVNKRQYKIRNEKLIYCFDSDVKVDDDILQQELLNNTNDKMKNIVVSIQREQNQIIRCSEKENVVVLGVAGSGKTSIALHRVAYLLYKLRGKLSSTEVLILSPNKIFSDYISEVLPELNEQNAIETTLIQIAKQELKLDNLENKQEQVERILTKQKISETYKLKNGYQFFKNLYNFITDYCNNNFKAEDITLGKIVVPKQKIQNIYTQKIKYLPFVRINEIIENLVEGTFSQYKQIIFKIQEFISMKLRSMFADNNPITVYTKFLNSIGLKFGHVCGKIKNEDVYPILLIHYFIYGSDDYTKYKHLIVDEMQDYNPVQFFIINSFFPCTKTILGDENQSVSVSIANKLIDHLPKILFDNTEDKVLNFDEMKNEINLLKLNKSYRNSYEISKLANSIIQNKTAELIMRDGKTPQLIKLKTKKEFIKTVVSVIESYQKDYKNIAIITKNEAQAIKIYEILKNNINLKLITAESDNFRNGVLIMSAYQSKGLEFDASIIFNVNKNNYDTSLDSQLLYVAVTRALHAITLIYTEKPTKFIKDYFKLGE